MNGNIPLHVIAVTAVIKKDNKYLLAKRSSGDDQSPGEWSLPGGKVENEVGERRLEDALKREVMEEVGVEIMDEVRLIYNDSFIRSSGHHVVMLTFLCEWKSGEAKPLEDQEEVAWMSIEEIFAMDNLPEYIRKRMSLLN